MNAEQFRALYRELIEENPLAVRAVLKVLDLEFTDTVPTAAVTCEERPRLLVNLGFVSEHCHTDAEAKALVMHEFLHVLLRHTENLGSLDAAGHVALDAVINAVIHRSLGEEYSSLMSRYYARADWPNRLLRPPEAEEGRICHLLDWDDPLPGRFGRPAWRREPVTKRERRLLNAWEALYEGNLVADDVRDLARDLGPKRALRQSKAKAKANGQLLGNHDPTLAGDGQPLPAALAGALDRSLKTMNGYGIWRGARDRGMGCVPRPLEVSSQELAIASWRRQARAVLRRCLQPDPTARARDPVWQDVLLPVLAPGDRRAALACGWSPFLPLSRWDIPHAGPRHAAQVYLDVSGSMVGEMPHVVALLGELATWIRRPFWAFSDVVAPARIVRGQLQADTTGGTSLACVLEHVARTRPESAVIVTDGYVEKVDPALVAAAARTRLHAIVTHHGNPGGLRTAGIPCTQLGALPR